MVGDHIDYRSRDFFLVDRSMEKAQEFNSFLVEDLGCSSCYLSSVSGEERHLEMGCSDS